MNWYKKAQGFDKEKGKSQRAITAEEAGLLTAPNIAQQLNLPLEFISKHAPSEEWHHTGQQFKETQYYSIDKVKAWMGQEGNDLLEMYQDQLTEWKPVIIPHCTIRWEEYTKERTRKGNVKTIQKKLHDVTLKEINPQMIEFVTPDGTIRKLTNTKKFQLKNPSWGFETWTSVSNAIKGIRWKQSRQSKQPRGMI